MAYSNNNKMIWDTPVWLPTGQFRTITSAVASMAGSKSTNERYIYYLAGTLFYVYDTWKDTHIKLASPMTPALTGSSIVYSNKEGYRGNCLSATNNTIELCGLNGNVFNGKEIEITSGIGAGQRRTITTSSENAIWDSGMVTTATANLLTDTTKRWEINQYIGYQVRVVYGTGASQVRKVLYNDATTLYFFDANYQQLEPWNNTAFSATAPYAVPVATASLQANYYIESSIATVSVNWTTNPDDSSSFLIKTGGVFMATSFATAPWMQFQYYDVASDTWTYKTALGGHLLAALGTDFKLEIISKEKLYGSGTATSGTARTLVDTTKTLTVDRWCNYSIFIASGTGTGQEQRIVANGTNYYEVERPWEVNPNATSVYEIHGESNRIWLSGNGGSSLFQYSIEMDQWFTGNVIDFGTANNISCKYKGQEPFGIATGVYAAAGITVLNPIPTVKGTGYAVGDLFNITTGGTVGKGRVESISAGGVVETVSLYSAGLTYTTGASKATTIISGAGNNGLQVNITTVGGVNRITTSSNVNLLKGDQVTIAGNSNAGHNAVYNVLAIDGLTTFDVLSSTAANMAATSTNTTTIIVDTTKNFVIDEHIGKIVKLEIAGTQVTSQFRRITSNTATTITVATIAAGTTGTSRYCILNPQAFGSDLISYKDSDSSKGRATGGTSVTLVDSSKVWQVGQWVGYRVRILAGTGVGKEVVISANTADTLTITTPGFTPDTTTKYRIMDTFGIATGGFLATALQDTTKNWVVNKWAGKRLKIVAGTGAGAETTIQSNTANTLTYTTIVTVVDATSVYVILAPQPRSTGTCLFWLYGNTTLEQEGRHLLSFRGGATNTWDMYDIVRDQWDITEYFMSQSETFTLGSSYSYDGVDTIYASVAIAADFIYVHGFDINTKRLVNSYQTTVLAGTAHTGNLMEIVTSPDGGSFLFLGICSSRLMYKTLLY